MKKLIVVFLISNFVLLSCYAETYNTVSSLNISGVNILNPIKGETFYSLFKSEPIIKKIEFSECTANYDAYFVLNDLHLRVEFYKEINDETLFNSIGNLSHIINGLNGLLWMEINNFKMFSGKVLINGYLINSDVTLKELSKIFPDSYKLWKKNPEEAFILLVNFDKNRIEKKEQDTASIPYVKTVNFYFQKGKLRKFSVMHGIAC